MNDFSLWDTSTEREKSRHYFGVLLFKIPFSVLEISPFYLGYTLRVHVKVMVSSFVRKHNELL